MLIKPCRDAPWRQVSLLATFCFASAVTLAAEVELTEATIGEVNADIDAGELNSVALVEIFLNRIEAYDQQGPASNAALTLNPSALDQERAASVARRCMAFRSR